MDTEYKIPDHIFNRIKSAPNFKQIFFSKLDDIFPNGWRYPEDEGHYINISSTVGWGSAFEYACIQCDMFDVWQHYDRLSWDDSDSFDWELEKYLDERIDE